MRQNVSAGVPAYPFSEGFFDFISGPSVVFTTWNQRMPGSGNGRQDVTYCGHSRAVFAEGKMPAWQMYIFLSVFSVYHDTGDDKRPGKHLHNRICLPGPSDLYAPSGHIHPVYFSALIRISHCSRCWSPFRSAGPDRCLLALIFRMIWACLMFSWHISG